MARPGVTVELSAGARVLTGESGICVVKLVGRHGVDVENAWGAAHFIAYNKLTVSLVGDDGIEAVHAALEPEWSSLSNEAREQALFRLEVILEVITGYRLGFAYLALAGEPFHPFGDKNVSLTKRTDEMARRLTFERSVDRELMRRVREGELASHTITGQTIRGWIRRFQKTGLLGLVDRRRTRAIKDFDDLDPRYRAIAEEEFARFDGTVSQVNIVEIERRILERLRAEHGISDDGMPQRLTQEYLSAHNRSLGRGTRAHASRAHRKIASRSSYPVLHPAHLVCDVTRLDGFVYDELLQRPISVEVSAYMSAAAKTVHSVRVTPMSARATDVSLGLYDVFRPQSMVVDGTTLSDFRWVGVPEDIEWASNPTIRRRRLVDGPQQLDGVHHLPGLTPGSIRTDNGTIYLSRDYRAVLQHWGIDHYPSRGKKPTDNPQIERQWDGWMQRAVQELDGFKGRSVFERGRLCITADTPLMTWRELETYLRWYAAIVYHRTQHDGLRIAGAHGAKITPLEMFDWLLQMSGRITVPQHPDLIYDFLPVRWLTPGNAGVEYAGITYDGGVLDSIGLVRRGSYRDHDDKVPFIIDPRDPVRIWHRSREDGRVHELRDRDEHRYDQPLTSYLRDLAVQQIRARGGNEAVSRREVRREIIANLGSLSAHAKGKKRQIKLSAAQIRWEQAQIDHADVDTVRVAASTTAGEGLRLRVVDDPAAPNDTSPTGRVPADEDTAWPDYDAEGY